VEAEGPLCSVGECCEIVDGEGERHLAEVIGFRGRHVLAMPLKATQGIRYGDAVLAMGVTPGIAVGTEMEGRIVDALGSPLDGLPAPRVAGTWPLDGTVPHPMEREVIREPLQTGLRVLDGMLTVGRGQRVGVFGGSGVGKSTLIGMMTRNTAADLTVVGLVGERGREVREFVEDSLGEEGRKRSVVLVSTSDQSPLLRMRAAMAATSVAEFYAARGKHVLLVLDSLSRLMPAVTTPEHRRQAATVRRLLAAHARSEDLIRIGAYKAGTDEDLDRAIRAMPLLREFLEQRSDERVTMHDAVRHLNAMEL
jgi:flagellum-specific ATP synthase